MKRTLVYISFCLCFFSSCENENRTRIPSLPVFLKLNLTTQYPTFRDNVNDTLVFVRPRVGYELQDQLGFGGILVVVGIGERGTDYFAYDLACPYEVDARVRIFPNAQGKAVCRKCGSEFYLTDGWGRVSKSPSRWSLRRYTVDYVHTGAEEYLILQE